jgi:hypothetical protein
MSAEPLHPEPPTPSPSCSGTGPSRSHPRAGLLAGLGLCVLLSLLLNDRRQPAPITMWALVATFLVLGRHAYMGLRWLMWHSPLRFSDETSCPGPLDWVARLVPWLGFGVAAPAALLASLLLLVYGQPVPCDHFGALVLMSMLPTSAACLALLPIAWRRIEGSPTFTARDRAVLPISAGLLSFVMLLTWLMHLEGPQLLPWYVLRLMFKSFLPSALPHHIIGVTVAGAFLRSWFRWTGDTGCPVMSGRKTE